MPAHNDDDADAARGETVKPAANPGRKPYRAPRLVTYGNLPRLVTMAKGGRRNDGGGKPKTRV